MSVSPPELSLNELAAYPEVRIGHHGSLLVMIWRGEITAQSIERVTAVEHEFVKTFPRISSLGFVIGTATGNADPKLIRAAADAVRSFNPNVRATAVVILADRTVSAITQLIVDGLILLIGPSERLRVFSSVDDAMAWLWKVPGQDAALLRVELVEAIRRFVQDSGH